MREQSDKTAEFDELWETLELGETLSLGDATQTLRPRTQIRISEADFDVESPPP